MNYARVSQANLKICSMYHRKPIGLTALQVRWSGNGTYNLVLNYKEIPDPDDCEPNPCAEGATCVDRSFKYTCVCPPNTSGRNCEGIITPVFFENRKKTNRKLKFLSNKNGLFYC